MINITNELRPSKTTRPDAGECPTESFVTIDLANGQNPCTLLTIMLRHTLTAIIIVLLIGGPVVSAVPRLRSVSPNLLRAQTDKELDAIWDLDAIKDTGTLRAELVATPVTVTELATRLKVFQVVFSSFDEGQGPIRIHGFVALPADKPARSLPAVIFGHGAGGEGEESVARGLAVTLSAAVISFSGPGQGRSSGRPSTSQNWMRTNPIQQSWLYLYAYSAMRAVTYMATLPEVDPERIALTGVSAGGLMTWIANGVDDRLAAACPIMATGDFRRSFASGSWLRDFPVGIAGMNEDSPQVQAFIKYLDPLHYAHRQYAPVMLINGAQDEFFPIDTTLSTFEALEAPEKRIEVVFDWDHGYFADSSPALNTYNNSQRALTRIFSDLAAWFRWHLADGDPLPPTPEIKVTQNQWSTTFTVTTASTEGAVTAQLLYSTDGAYSFRRYQMNWQPDGSYSLTLFGTLAMTRLVYFAEVQYPGSVFLTTVPHLPEKFVPKIRPFPR